MNTFTKEQIDQLNNQLQMNDPIHEFMGLETLNEFLAQYTEPLGKLGFELKSFQFNSAKDNIPGLYHSAHFLIFEHNGDNTPMLSQIQACMVDDDNQPFSVFQFFFGTLYVFIPYTF